MRVLFCHDGPLRKDEVGNYYGIAHNNEMFKRYHFIGEEISVLIRVKQLLKKDAQKRYTKLTLDNFNVIECPNLANIKGMTIERIKAKKIIEEAVKTSDYIVVRLHGFVGLIAYDYAKKYNKPCLIELVGDPWDAYWNHSFKGKFFAFPMYLATKKRIAEASHVVYVTNEFLQKRYPTNGTNVNLSNVTLDEFNNITLPKRLKKIQEKTENEKIVIGTTAALDVRFKGQQYIIKALGELKKQGITKFEYQLVGSGSVSYLKSIAEKYDVSEQVKILGPMPHEDVFEWLENIDIYTQPSRQEGLPRALIEAMSKGLPAFGARTAGIPELIEDDYIFSNSRKNIIEIIDILKSFDKDSMLKQAKRNYEESKKYDKNLIENRRNQFLKCFKDSSTIW